MNIFWTLSLLILVTSSHAQSIRIVTEDFAPYNYVEQGTPKGISTEIVQAIQTELIDQTIIKTYPFKRTMAIALSHPNTLIYSIVRTAERENQFEWIGTLVPMVGGLFKLTSRTDIQPKTLNDLHKYRISDIQGSAIWEYLTQKNIKVHEIPTTQQNIKLLKLGRMDLIATDELNFYFEIKRLRFNPKDFASAFPIQDMSTDLWLAINKDSDKQLILDLKQAMNKVKASQTFTEILDRYYLYRNK